MGLGADGLVHRIQQPLGAVSRDGQSMHDRERALG